MISNYALTKDSVPNRFIVASTIGISWLIIASTAETGFLTDVITYGTLTADSDDNTLWNTTTSTSTTGVEQSAEVISVAASDTDATLDSVDAY